MVVGGALNMIRSLDFPGGPVVKNLRAMQRTRVRTLVWGDFACYGATKPVRTITEAHVL